MEEVENYEGKTVTVSGSINEYRITQYGGQIITIIDTETSSEALVYTDKEKDIQYGDFVKVTGKVQKYNDEWEIVVEDSKLIETIRKYSDIKTPIWQLAISPDKYLGLNVNVSGFVERDYESYFYLVDDSEKYSIAVYYDNSRTYNFTLGDLVYVEGRLIYEEEFLRYSISSIGEDYKISRV